jgi:hypothetical protein
LDTKNGICAGNFFPGDTPRHGPSWPLSDKQPTLSASLHSRP